jgi:hypothetical protein
MNPILSKITMQPLEDVLNLSVRELCHIRKVIEEWNPYGLEESIYGIESNEIFKCIRGNNNDPISHEKIAHCIQKILIGYAPEMNEEFYLDLDECLIIAKKFFN